LSTFEKSRTAAVCINYKLLTEPTKPLEEALQSDIRRADWYRYSLKVAPQHTIIIGDGMGCIPAARLALQGETMGTPYPFGGLVLYTPFSNTTELIHLNRERLFSRAWLMSLFSNGQEELDNVQTIQALQHTPMVLIVRKTEPGIPYQIQQNLIHRLLPLNPARQQVIKEDVAAKYSWPAWNQAVRMLAPGGALYQGRRKPVSKQLLEDKDHCIFY
jgi:hypothetical protein